MQLEPMQVAMTNSHVIATSEDLSTSHTFSFRLLGFSGGFHGLRLVTEDVVYIWNYRSSVSRQAQGDLASAAAGMKQRRAEMMFHIDESFAPGRFRASFNNNTGSNCMHLCNGTMPSGST
eukprot:symbB.v1.2.014208.t1/scaffold1027.1/size171366/10